MSRRRVVVKQQKPQGGGMQAAMKEVRVFCLPQGTGMFSDGQRTKRKAAASRVCGPVCLLPVCVRLGD